MQKIELTKEADALICTLYNNFLQKRKAGTSRGDAKWLGSASHIQKTLVPQWSLGDIEDVCRELSRADLLNCQFADNTVHMALLTDTAIIYMENRFKNGVSEVLDYLEQIKSILLW